MAAKSTGIDMEQNYVTVTLCIDTNGIRKLYTTCRAEIDTNMSLFYVRINAQQVCQLCLLTSVGNKTIVIPLAIVDVDQLVVAQFRCKQLLFG